MESNKEDESGKIEYAKIVGKGEIQEVYVEGGIFGSPRGSIDKSLEVEKDYKFVPANVI